MEKISPPLRIALVAVMLLAVAWFVVLRPKAPSEPASPPPGIGGLSNDVKRAQSATATANAAAAAAQNTAANVDAANGAGAATKTTNATATATKSNGASATVTKSTTSTAAKGAAPAASKGAVTKSTESATVTGANGTTVTATKKTTKAVAKPKAKAPAKPKVAADPAAPLVAALKHNKAVILLFRNSSSDSQAVADAVRAVPKQVKRVVVRVAPIGQVGRYSTFTEKTQISQAPTVIVIGPGRRARVIVGYTSTAEVAEAVGDLRRAARR